MRTWIALLLGTALLCASLVAWAAGPGGRIEGTVVLEESGDHLHAATVHLLELGRTTMTDDEGRFRFENVPAGTYHIIAHVASTLTEESQQVAVTAGQTAEVTVHLGLAPLKQEVTVTATGRPVTAFEAMQSVETRDSFELAADIAPSLGETLAGKPGNGVAKRSFGPGSERPIIRGFDGDRVLIMQDGERTGTLSSQSGEHGELVNTANLDQVEIVKGPATLLYGGNAVGGVVNMISRHHAVHEHPHKGLRGFVSGTGGSAGAFGSGAAGIEFGVGKWLLWGGGSGQSSGEYSTPLGQVPDSDTRVSNGYGGFGWYGDRVFFSLGGGYDQGVYGVPYAAEIHGGHDHEHGHEHEEGHGEEEHEHGELERVELDARRQYYNLGWGLRNLGKSIESFVLRLGYTRWIHDEVEVAEGGARTVATNFDNRQFTWRGALEQAKRGPWTGRFGFWGMTRDYAAAGEEALSPPVDQLAAAGFALEELELERVKLQFGARVEHNRYQPGPWTGVTPLPVRDRSFTGASASAGVNAGLWRGGAFVANYTRSYRPPALEELYSYGPHVGNLAFEIGDPSLLAETGDGIDLSVRHQTRRAGAEANFFYYDFGNFVFPYSTGEFEDGLQVVRFAQADSRFLGTEANLSYGLRSSLWLHLGADYVSATEKATRSSLPRIPPLRGRLGLEWRSKGLSVTPGLVLANRQGDTYLNEAPTPGYALVDLKASYTITRGHLIHQFAVNTFNLGDRLYYNHSSFIKNLAPEIGRGLRFTYRVRFF